ncbi:3436_t:CDS:1, partial [Dentiscutata heterogama]
YYEVSFNEFKKYVKSIEDDEILSDLLPAIKKITGVKEYTGLYAIKKISGVKDLNEDTVLYTIKKVNESKDLKEDIALHALKEIIKGIEGEDSNNNNTKDWNYDDMAPVENDMTLDEN